MKDDYRNSCIKSLSPSFFWVKTDNDYVISFIKNFATAHLLAHVPLQVNWGRQLNVTHARKMNSDEASKVLFHATQKA